MFVQRRHQTPVRALPADQRFDTDHGARLEIDLRLIVEDEFVLLERLSQLVFQQQPFGNALAHLLGIEQIALARVLAFCSADSALR